MSALQSVVSIIALIKIMEKYGTPALEEALGITTEVEVTVQEIEKLIIGIKPPQSYFKENENETT